MNVKTLKVRPVLLIAVLVAMTFILPAMAASPRLDDANAHLVKAKALLKAAAYAAEPRAERSHRERAIKLIEQAEQEIVRAKKAADTSAGRRSGMRRLP